MVSGFVPKDAEFKQTQSGKNLTTWGVKVGEKQVEGQDKSEAIWTNCQAWGDEAIAASAIRKGDKVLCVGRIQVNEHEGKQYKNLVCDFIAIQSSGNVPAAPQAQPQQNNSILTEYEEVLSDGDVPF